MIVELVERGMVPDLVTRAGVRRLLRDRLTGEHRGDQAAQREAKATLLSTMRRGPIAESVELANAQHYEQPAEFFRLILGRWMKYSSGLWTPGVSSIDQAEQAMLRLTCERAGIRDGMRVLDLGCGWGSLSLWVATHYPDCDVTAVSNSSSQREFIARRARRRGLENVQVITADMNRFETDRRFDRVVSVEMFEHMRNYEALLRRISGWLDEGGRLFVHIFCHRELAYFYEVDGDNDWMARHFFTGGMMPSEDLLRHFPQHLEVHQHWVVNGRHYARTLEAWLQRLDERRGEVLELFRRDHADAAARRWLNRWRVFLMACAELFAYGGGEEWRVAHYLLAPAAKR